MSKLDDGYSVLATLRDMFEGNAEVEPLLNLIQAALDDAHVNQPRAWYWWFTVSIQQDKRWLNLLTTEKVDTMEKAIQQYLTLTSKFPASQCYHVNSHRSPNLMQSVHGSPHDLED